MINEPDFPLYDYGLEPDPVILHGFTTPTAQTLPKIHVKYGKIVAHFSQSEFSSHARNSRADVEHSRAFAAIVWLQELVAAEHFQKERKILQILQACYAVTEDLQDIFSIFCKTRFCNRNEIGLDQQLVPSGIQAELKKKRKKEKLFSVS